MLNYLFIITNLGIFISALMLILKWNPIQKLLSLISLFLFASFLFIFLNFYFLGLTYLIVYIGAIAILFLFIIMMIPLTPQTPSGFGATPQSTNYTPRTPSGFGLRNEGESPERGSMGLGLIIFI